MQPVITPDEAAHDFVAMLDEVYATGKAAVIHEQPAEHLCGDVPAGRYYDLVLQPIWNADGATDGIFVQGIDVTERVNALSVAQQAIAARDQFLSIASHELRNPLAVLSGMSQLLTRQLAPGVVEMDVDRARRLASSVQAATEQLTRLVGELLDVSRVQTGRFHVNRVATDLAALMTEAVEQARLLAPNHPIALDDSRRHTGCTVFADPDRLRQVIGNLLDNAVKYSPDGGAVTVALDMDGDGVVLRVRDRGIGLPPGVEEQIFEPFGRASNAGGCGIPGLGLGLYVSRQIVAAHDGRVWVESTGEGAGTTFCVWLPSMYPADPAN